ncbi:hypothetical protein IDJ77_18395 [Mucilaginibacter sp. ZT4R22]|uniref:Uncharacterized protein n=1 Tax=Mucilaginibacter pankratovii TaxID=2772110 RepID=A0ABR7WUC2_9SPHI|nr:hypothetical protein [Mucilaginibacter pankratovii]MBD1365793.1 hypothetical protein [Mucilaginibacter pankratovii]
MKLNLPVKSLLLALALTVSAAVCWELYLRSKGIEPDFDDSPELWANARAMAYEPADKATVFIGSSRIKYDLDIPTWESKTNTRAVQLAMVGSSPRSILADLANDPLFKGRLVVDVTEVLFFNNAPYVLASPEEGINYYKKRTPAQTASFAVDKYLEANLVLLDRDFYSVNGLLNHLYVPNRMGVYAGLDFPVGFGFTSYNRQTKMTASFLADTNRVNQVRGIWGMLAKENTAPPMGGKELDSFFAAVKQDVNKIKARGGEVVFLRTPSSGPFFMGESMGYPRAKYWDRLLTTTGCKGIYFKDYPTLANLVCPEFSHLTPDGAVVYTNGMIAALKQQTNWKL